MIRTALERDDSKASAWGVLGLSLAEQDRQDAAVRAFGEAVSRGAESAIHYNLGLALSRLKRFEPAAAAFREAIRVDPANADARVDLALTLADLGWDLSAHAGLIRSLVRDEHTFDGTKLHRR